MTAGDPITIGKVSVPPGGRQTIALQLPRLYTHNEVIMPVRVIHGERPGNHRLFLTAAIHGDELNGVEIVRRVLEHLTPKDVTGVVVAVPVVNVYGIIHQSRYLPDRRDLNRSFPGSNRGALASQVAHLLMSEIVSKCTHGVDLHTGSLHRVNLPQIRANLRDDEARRCAKAFRAPVVLHAATRDGSLREAASHEGVSTIVYEAGEPQRFTEDCIRTGVNGILRLMRKLKMYDGRKPPSPPPSIEISKSSWIRASHSGIFHQRVGLGDTVPKRTLLGIVTDAFGDQSYPVYAPHLAIVIGLNNNPLVHRGDAVVHLGIPKGESA